MNNYIIKNYRGAALHMSAAAVENLRKYTPRGCCFNYDLFELLNDLIIMYNWKMENGRKYSIAHFLELTNDIKATIYKNAILEIIAAAGGEAQC